MCPNPNTKPRGHIRPWTNRAKIYVRLLNLSYTRKPFNALRGNDVRVFEVRTFFKATNKINKQAKNGALFCRRLPHNVPSSIKMPVFKTRHKKDLMLNIRTLFCPMSYWKAFIFNLCVFICSFFSFFFFPFSER